MKDEHTNRDRSDEWHRQEYARLIAENRRKGLGSDPGPEDLAREEEAVQRDKEALAESEQFAAKERAKAERKSLFALVCVCIAVVLVLLALRDGNSKSRSGLSYEDVNVLRR